MGTNTRAGSRVKRPERASNGLSGRSGTVATEISGLRRRFIVMRSVKTVDELLTDCSKSVVSPFKMTQLQGALEKPRATAYFSAP